MARVTDQENPYEGIFNNSHTIMLLIDPETAKIVNANPAASRFYGYSREELLRKKITDINTLSEQEVFEEMERARSENRQVFLFQHRLADGQIRDVEVSSGTVNSHGKQLLYSIVVDITDRLRAERDCLESEARFRGIYHGMPLPTFTWRKSSQDYILVDYNEAASQVTRGRIHEFLGSPSYALFRDRTDVRSQLERCFVEKSIRRLETTYEFITTGELKEVIFTFNYVPPDLVLEYVEDVTQRRQTERKLINSENRYRAIVEDQTELISRFLPDNTLVFVNGAFSRYFKKPIDALIGTNFLESCAAEDRERLRVHLNALDAQNPVGTVEYRAALPNGDTAWMQTTTRAILGQNSFIVEYQSVGRDITDRKKIEEQRTASLKEKEVLLQEIHHRVKNNMSVINSLLNLQARKIEDERLKSIFRESQTRIASMALIHETLYQSESLAAIDFQGYVSKLANSLHRLFNTPSSKVRLNIEAENVALQIDQAAPCGLVINELLTNSFKYAFPGDRNGTIFIKAQVCDEGSLEIVVKDDGIGIPAHIDIRQAGTLGLSLVSNLVERQLKGDLELNREQGTQFTIRFHCGPRSNQV